jgi:hypothetical protein
MVEMSEVFWSFFITATIGFILKMSSILYKSKCKEFDCLCFHIVRDVEAENAADAAAAAAAVKKGDGGGNTPKAPDTMEV